MKQIVFATALLFACFNIRAMEQQNAEQIGAMVAEIFVQTTRQAVFLAQNKDTLPEQWGSVLKNAGKLEAALQFNLISDEKAKENVRKWLDDIDAAFNFYVKSQQKVGALKTLQVIAPVVAKHETENEE